VPQPALPKCQSSAAQRWLEARHADLLPVPYYHVVFTLPAPISAIAYTNKEILYGLLFDLAAETLRTIAADPKHLAPGSHHPGAAYLGSALTIIRTCTHRTRWRLAAMPTVGCRASLGSSSPCGSSRACSGVASRRATELHRDGS